jgi:hypothetical protein
MLEEAQERHLLIARGSVDHGMVDRTVGPLGMEVPVNESCSLLVNRSTSISVWPSETRRRTFSAREAYRKKREVSIRFRKKCCDPLPTITLFPDVVASWTTRSEILTILSASRVSTGTLV